MSIWFVVLIIFSVTAKIIVTICEDNSKGVLANQKQYQKKPHVKRPENEYRKFERITGPDLPMTDLPSFIPALWNSRVISEVKMENPVEKEIAAVSLPDTKLTCPAGRILMSSNSGKKCLKSPVSIHLSISSLGCRLSPPIITMSQNPAKMMKL